MTTLSSSDKAVAPCTEHSESRRAYLSDQFKALLEKKRIATTQDAIAASYLKSVQALPLNDFDKPNFFWGMALLMDNKAFPLVTDVELLDLIAQVYKRFFAVKKPINQLTSLILSSCYTGTKGTEFSNHLVNTYLSIHQTPTNLLEWKIFFLGMIHFRKPIPVINFWLRYSDQLSKINKLERLISDFHRRELNSLEVVLKSKRKVSNEKLEFAIFLIKILNIPYEFRFQFGKIIRDFLNDVYPFVYQRIKNLDSPQQLNHSIRLQFISWVHITHSKLGRELNNNANVFLRTDLFRKLAKIPFYKVLKYLPDFALINFENLSSELFCHLASGQNIRTFSEELPFTKKMAHIFHNLTSNEVQVNNTYLYCLIKSLGGEQELFNILQQYFRIDIMSANGDHFRIEDRLSKLSLIICKLIDWNFHSLDRNTVYRLCGFISHIFQDLPDFKIKGRTLSSFIRLANEYQVEIELQQEIKRLNYQKATWKGAVYNNWEGKIKEESYKIIQLHSVKELVLESNNLSHCVRSYGNQCINNSCSIYSFRKIEDKNIDTPLVTIEIRNGRIVQAKAKYNAIPSEAYLDIIKAWAKNENLIFDRW